MATLHTYETLAAEFDKLAEEWGAAADRAASVGTSLADSQHVAAATAFDTYRDAAAAARRWAIMNEQEAE